MSPRTVERVDDWETVPFGGGYSGLRDLASQEFSGVVTAGPTRLFMIRGTVVGVLDGSIDDFEGSEGNAREAPHPALPLLAVMQEHSDEVRAKYYTVDTPVSDVDQTLADGSFTGYVELSENVLSGDYYQVYHQGRSMSVAYVGSAERLITDDDAFEQANDEVGIYEVRPVDIEPIDIPEPTDDAAGASETGATDAEASPADSTADESAREAVSDVETESDSTDVDVPSATGDSDAAEPGPGEPVTGESDSRQPPTTVDSDDQAAESGTVPEAPSPTDETPATTSTSETADSSATREADGTDGESDDPHPAAGTSTSRTDSSPSTERSASGQGKGTNEQSSRPHESTEKTRAQQNDADPETARQSPDAGGTESDRSTAEQTQSTTAGHDSRGDGQKPGGSSPRSSAADLEMRSIPSLDPARTEAASKAKAKRTSGTRGDGTTQASQSQQSQSPTSQSQGSSTPGTPERTSREPDQRPTQESPRQQSGPSDTSPTDQQPGAKDTQQASRSGDETAELAAELESRDQEIEDLRTDLERVEAERDELQTQLADLEGERDRLRTELEESQAEIERLTDRLDDAAAGEPGTETTRLSAAEAIENTNLFVRYRSKGDATLETAHAGNADRSAVADNLRLEYHTQFEADDAAVGNEPFDDFLTETIQYRFVDWLIGTLLYEIRDTGHADAMADLYNALPKIDRAELNGQVTVSYTEDGEEHRSQERFDVVLRDRMGNPLVVANINDSRDPATDAMMTDLVKRAERVGASGDTLAGAFLVTESFFEPEALETAEGATSSGLFSRDKRKSFVNLSRKDGYHLCLVEARNEEFHLAVPEL